MKCVIITFVLVVILQSCQGDSYLHYANSLLTSTDNAALISTQFHLRDRLLIRKRRDTIELMTNEIAETTLGASTTSKPKIGSENVAHSTDKENQHNVTKTNNDTPKFYKISFSADEPEAKKFWVDMANHPNASVNNVLSHSYGRAETVELSFDFPFYGQLIRNVTVLTDGFLYTGELVHKSLAATQYVAPLMANFDTRLSNNSKITYADNGTAFTVEWKKVILEEQPEVGKFTFQVTLLKNGDIIFVYAAVPLPVQRIQDNLQHPVKVGVSDAYSTEREIFSFLQKTIWEYDRLNLKSQDIGNWTVIKLRALPTCLGLSSCNDCLNKRIGFDCKWCQSVNRCSTGTDRHTQNWISNDCHTTNIAQGEICPAIITNAVTYEEHEHDSQKINLNNDIVQGEDL